MCQEKSSRHTKGVQLFGKVLERIKIGEEIPKIMGGKGQIARSLAGKMQEPQEGINEKAEPK